jgi:hypothetical protein
MILSNVSALSFKYPTIKFISSLLFLIGVTLEFLAYPEDPTTLASHY